MTRILFENKTWQLQGTIILNRPISYNFLMINIWPFFSYLNEKKNILHAILMSSIIFGVEYYKFVSIQLHYAYNCDVTGYVTSWVEYIQNYTKINVSSRSQSKK